MAFALKHIFERDVLPYLKDILPLLQQLDNQGEITCDFKLSQKYDLIPHSAPIFMNKRANIFPPDNQVLFSVVS